MHKKSSGFTLVELLVVLTILAIIVAIAVPSVTRYKEMAEERVCSSNRKTVERMYSSFLLENDTNAEIAFNQFLLEKFKGVCPAGSVISYEDGKVKCSVHGDASESDEEEEPGGEVPWL